ncbi:MAG: hypothetical protein OHK0039_47450 [Bacteroidia bacterium]
MCHYRFPFKHLPMRNLLLFILALSGCLVGFAQQDMATRYPIKGRFGLMIGCYTPAPTLVYYREPVTLVRQYAVHTGIMPRVGVFVGRRLEIGGFAEKYIGRNNTLSLTVSPDGHGYGYFFKYFVWSSPRKQPEATRNFFCYVGGDHGWISYRFLKGGSFSGGAVALPRASQMYLALSGGFHYRLFRDLHFVADGRLAFFLNNPDGKWIHQFARIGLEYML